jgi:hypothetical protein
MGKAPLGPWPTPASSTDEGSSGLYPVRAWSRAKQYVRMSSTRSCRHNTLVVWQRRGQLGHAKGMQAPCASLIRVLIVGFVFSGLTRAQSPSHGPTLRDTLDWLTGTSEKESGDGSEYIEFESKGCQAVITEHRVTATPEFVIRMEFSLGDIDPSDFSVLKLGTGKLKGLFGNQTSVAFHTRNYAKKMRVSDTRDATPTPASEYQFTTDGDFAPRFAHAMKRAAELCGAKPASF